MPKVSDKYTTKQKEITMTIQNTFDIQKDNRFSRVSIFYSEKDGVHTTSVLFPEMVDAQDYVYKVQHFPETNKEAAIQKANAFIYSMYGVNVKFFAQSEWIEIVSSKDQGGGIYRLSQNTWNQAETMGLKNLWKSLFVSNETRGDYVIFHGTGDEKFYQMVAEHLLGASRDTLKSFGFQGIQVSGAEQGQFSL